MIISFIVRIMHDHVLFHHEVFYTDIFVAAHHAEMTVRVNDQIKKIIILFSKKHVSSVTFLNNLFKQ